MMNNEMMLQMMMMMNPEMAPVLQLMQQNLGDQDQEKPKRKPSAYNRRYAAAYRRIKKKHMLKNGNMAKGWTGKRGHARIVKMAHAEAKKGGRKR